MRGKSLYMLNRFEQWYLEGNRVPANVGVRIYDIEGIFENMDEWSDELREKKFCLVYFMCAYGGGFPNAEIYIKDNPQ